jgi:transposase-like protein
MAIEPMPAVPPEDELPPRHCPRCRVGTLVRVEHQPRAGGRSYERYFCPRCGSSVETFGERPAGRLAEG